MKVLTWKRGLPKEAGWYWFRNLQSKTDDIPQVYFVRSYGGELAISNCHIEGCCLYENGEWAGPIEMPSEDLK